MTDTLQDDQHSVPDWPICQATTEAEPCIGQKVSGFDLCLTHLSPAQLNQVIDRLGPGAEINANGTRIDVQLLDRILRAMRGETGVLEFGPASFVRTHFTSRANFSGARFRESVMFNGARFGGIAEFSDTHFEGNAGFMNARFDRPARFNRAKLEGPEQIIGTARFDGAMFSDSAGFEDAHFGGTIWFAKAQFMGSAGFYGAHFAGMARFDSAKFHEPAWFEGTKFDTELKFNSAQFGGSARFDHSEFGGEVAFRGVRIDSIGMFNRAHFKQSVRLGPMVAETIDLSEATFDREAEIEVAAVKVVCRGATWAKGVTLRLRYAQVSFEGATFVTPSSVVGTDRPMKDDLLHLYDEPGAEYLDESQVRETIVSERDDPLEPWIPTLRSLRGANADKLSVTDVDLSACHFAGAILLDQIRLEGRCIFDRPPRGWQRTRGWPPLWRWSGRQSLAEERIWRSSTRKYAGWAVGSSSPAEIGPDRLAGLYRQLRKAQEDAKNEPGAADFYYGEMEMRRKSYTTPGGERSILWLYWLFSGYGLRAIRSLAALGILTVIVTMLLIGWGMATSASQNLTGTVTGSPHTAARINASLQATPTPDPLEGQRWTKQRARTALQMTLDSIVFRATDQPLTTTGAWTTMAARILGPVLLALALLAVRNRVKR